ncbi:MAG TPA: FMN-binding negative transcriptional regulator [Ramlibacter sp.]|uniref:FMN-binding negative transcriptional regulator n=1 Tax=Ramlibacter sp. TaxID=1917967 RepID=UPI002BF4898C|nr:FMN-binding negative transcriptional regulator [Ramlibacter sp.]HVZ44944.1 FMN-binding negative transcriptional regulator [Ramlibacter sp.]
MYQPPQFKSEDRAIAAELMRAHSFASLVSVDDGGLPYVTHLPLHLRERDDRFVLLGHCARPNPHWRYLQARPTALVTFLGPHAYQSPKIYADRQRVPSWNYLAVHCTVQARLLEAPEQKEVVLKSLIGDHEAAYAEQWASLDEAFRLSMLAGIMAFELDVVRWECKLKLNQHRPESHARLRAAYAEGNADERALAEWMQRLGLKGLEGN